MHVLQLLNLFLLAPQIEIVETTLPELRNASQNRRCGPPAEQFSVKEIADLSFAVSEINAWNRLMVCSRTPPQLASDKR
jgi:alkylhydroperoxidase family enzyme